MMPYLFKVGNFELRIYSLMIILALVITIFMAKRKVVRLGFKPEIIENMVIVIFVAAIIGARIYYVIFQWDHYKDNPIEIFAIWHGGLAIHGGIIMGFFAALIYSYYLKIRVMFFGDIIAPWLILGQGLGRIGNFANGEAHGVPVITPPEIIFQIKPIFTDFWQTTLNTFNISHNPESISTLAAVAKNGAEVAFNDKIYILKEYVPWGISFSSKFMPAAYQDFGNLAVHPTFFYEMTLNFLSAAFMYYFWRQDKYISTGIIFGMYLVFYGFIRGFVTMFRADDLMLGFMRAPHVASLAFIIIGLYLIIRGQKILKQEQTVQ